MSAGTLFALGAHHILMGLSKCPWVLIDPQFQVMPAEDYVGRSKDPHCSSSIVP